MSILSRSRRLSRLRVRCRFADCLVVCVLLALADLKFRGMLHIYEHRAVQPAQMNAGYYNGSFLLCAFCVRHCYILFDDTRCCALRCKCRFPTALLTFCFRLRPWCLCIFHNTEGQGEIPKNVFMVFEYLEYDLTGILETPEIRFTQDHIKSWSQQLLSGVHYMHTNKVIHRDLKASNLLVNKKGELKIADLGLARSWNSEMKRLTNKVITLWYRPPELLLGCLQYTTQIDMWSVGCIVAEMFRRSGFLKGTNEATQLDLIFRTCGHPTTEDWPDIYKTCRFWKKFEPAPDQPRFPNRLREALKANLPNPKWMTDSAVNLISKLMELNPDKRWTAEKALDADYFFETPIVKTPDKLSMNFAVTTVHEWECRRQYEKKQLQRKAHLQKMASSQTNGSRPPPPKGAPAGKKPPPPPRG